jgi:glyoxylase-like metal-dependent hydrolase (beta-lactamase superfamily II)
MNRMNRRKMMAATTGALALGTGLVRPALAKAPMLGRTRPHFRRIQLCAFEITTLLDGAASFPNPQSAFAMDQEPETVAAWLEQNNLPAGRMEIPFTPVLVNTGESLILFDTGNGPGARPKRGQLAQQIVAAGYTPGQIDTVVISHMHPDHIGGLMEDGAPAFPNAEYVTGALEYNFFSSDDRAGTKTEGLHKMVGRLVTPLAEKMSFIDPGEAIAPGIEAVAAYGHTPGHMAFHIESEGQRLLLTVDSANHYVLSLARPDWVVQFDMDKDAAAANRKQIFGMIAADRIAFIGYHMPFPGIGYVSTTDQGFRYEPASYQFDL